ncbi:hypothetical protein niasHT_009475 [Heterodera trifolii]|uniref:Uncharacterized protein n=1 Tax=Heterodera trifolii TaxID=157864 RepID=A0ABD2MEJ8_9BILA
MSWRELNLMRWRGWHWHFVTLPWDGLNGRRGGEGVPLLNGRETMHKGEKRRHLVMERMKMTKTKRQWKCQTQNGNERPKKFTKEKTERNGLRKRSFLRILSMKFEFT